MIMASALKPISGCNFSGKCLGLPCAAVLFFILFVLYSPDAYKRSIAVIPLALNRAAIAEAFRSYASKVDVNVSEIIRNASPDILRTFPGELIEWIHVCNKIAPLIVLGPESIRCLDGKFSDLCLSSSSSIYRFAIVADGQNEPESFLSKMVSDSLSIDWNISKVNVTPRAIMLKKMNWTVMVSVLELRPKYWYVHGNQLVQEPPRAFLGLNLTNIDFLTGDNKLMIPIPSDFYLWQWPRSTFLECNQTSAKYLRKKYPENYNVKAKIDDSFLDVLAYCRDLMLNYRITPMLAGGTGLGWYRECGIIPDTTDMDLMFPASEWNPELEKALKWDERMKLYWILGKPDDSLELSVYARSIKIDLFALYQEKNGSWVGGMIVGEKIKLRWWYPRYNQTCTADLKGHLFYVRCDIVAFLSADYGAHWYEPHHNDNFVWYKSHNNVQRTGKWKFSEWPKVYRTFP